MAAFANNRSRSNLSNQHPPRLPTSRPSTSPPFSTANNEDTLKRDRKLPGGPCNFRDLTVGPKPPGCGCRRFWLRAGLPEDSDIHQGQDPRCVCGHHACFHDRKENSRRGDISTESSPVSKESNSHENKASIPTIESKQSRSEGVLQGWLNSNVLASLNRAEPTATYGGLQAPNAPSTSQTTRQIPSFNLTSAELRGFGGYNASVGLGLDLQRNLYASRMASQSPTVADCASVAGELPLPSTRQASTEDNASPDSAFMRHIQAGRRMLPPLEVANIPKVPLGLGLDDAVQTASTVAAPTTMHTPDPAGLRELVNQASDLVDELQQSTALFPEKINPEGDADEHVAISSMKAIQTALESVPGALQRLAPILDSIQSQLSRNLDVSIHESINSLSKRMDKVENSSFSQLVPEHIHDKLQLFDLRLLDVETKAEEHNRLLSGLNPENSSRALRSKAKDNLNPNESFTSNHSSRSLDSATSSALIAAAIDRFEAAERMQGVEDRLDALETIQMPSANLPWNVEVVLLPWGAELQGLWYTSDALIKPGDIHDDEDLTLGSHPYTSASLGESGWSQHTLHHWLTGKDERMLAKACGINGIVYHRLKSRGFVRNITITNGGAREFSLKVCKSLGELLEVISKPGEGDRMDANDTPDLLGLKAPFIPLRKVHKSSRLRFLSDAELATPALWSAEFLSAGVMMRAPGGQKRLFITIRDGYEQAEDSPWTWARLRELPRIHDPDSQEPLNTDDVPEADADEPCWRYHAALDTLPSANASFQSHADSDMQHAYVQAEASQTGVRDELTDYLIRQPITPVSEFRPTQRSPLYHHRTRTISVPLSEPAMGAKAHTDSLRPPSGSNTSQQGKRRIRSFEQAPNPALIAALPTFIPSPAKTASRSLRIKKRRRITKSQSASSGGVNSQSSGSGDVESLHPEADPEQVLQHLQNMIPSGGIIKSLGQFEPRLQARRQSPSFEDDHGSENTNRLIAAETDVKRGVTPSAYATPFSGTVAGAGHESDDYLPSDSGSDDWPGVDDEDQASLDGDEDMRDDDDPNVESESCPDEDSEEELYDDYMDEMEDEQVYENGQDNLNGSEDDFLED